MGKYGKFRALVSLIATASAAPAHAACQLALVLALDVSSSVDEQEYVLQRDGLVAALLSDEVQDLLFSGQGDVAISVFEWSGLHDQHLILDWTILTGPIALQTAAEGIHAARRSRDDMPTSIGPAIGYASGLFRHAPACDRQVLDISGDGKHNHRYQPVHAYRAFPLENVTVNGLVIVGNAPELVDYYRTEVIKGPGAFVEVTPDFDNYEQAMKRKLLREIGAMVVGASDVE